MKRKKITIYAVVSGLLIASVLVYSFMDNSKSGIVFETAKIERGTINNTITATGTLEATNTVVVGTQVSGVIEKLYVDYNSVVKKGQLIAELDKSTLQSSLENAQADLDNAQAEYEYQEATLKRMQALFDKALLAQSDYDLALYNFKKSKAAVKSAQANMSRAARNLSYATIFSPIDGIVLNRAVEEGQTVAASMNTPELFTITNDLQKMQVEADIDEADIGMVKQNQRVTFTVDAFPELSFEGKVSEIRLQPNESSNVITYTVIVDVDNPEKKLKPGMTASITAYVEEASGVLLAAGKAIRFTPEKELMQEYINSLPEDQRMPKTGKRSGDRETNAGQKMMQGPPPEMEKNDDNTKTLWLKEGNKISPVRVKTGINDGAKIEILSGLSEGDEIVLSMAIGADNETVKKDKSTADSEQSSPFIQQRKGGGGPPR